MFDRFSWILLAPLVSGCTAAQPSDSETTTSTSPGTSGSSGSSGAGSTETSAVSTDAEVTSAASLESETTSLEGSSGLETSSTGEGCVEGTEGCACVRGACDDGLLCDADLCVMGTGCADERVGEPNGTPAQAGALGDVACGVIRELDAILGVGDEDWFSYHGLDNDCADDPIAIVDSALEVCMYMACDEGVEQAVCQRGADASVSPDGAPGCCNVASVQMAVNCLGAGGAGGDTSTVWLRVAGGERACVPYNLAYRF